MHAASRLLCILTILVTTETFTDIWDNYLTTDPVASYNPDADLYPEHNPELQERIVQYHNHFRSIVQPPASNMMQMTWSPEAARTAQEHASRCLFVEHSRAKQRTIPDFGQCGENLFASKVRSEWWTGIESWFSEYEMYVYGSRDMNRIYEDIAHYTQMVWATSHKVGCGMEHCQGGPWGVYYSYVCHYCPAGNLVVEYPYKVGSPCSDCPYDCNWPLCTNTCSRMDYYGNCEQLVPEACYEGVCNATCECVGKLYKNHPWK